MVWPMHASGFQPSIQEQLRGLCCPSLSLKPVWNGPNLTGWVSGPRTVRATHSSPVLSLASEQHRQACSPPWLGGASTARPVVSASTLQGRRSRAALQPLQPASHRSSNPHDQHSNQPHTSAPRGLCSSAQHNHVTSCWQAPLG